MGEDKHDKRVTGLLVFSVVTIVLTAVIDLPMMLLHFASFGVAWSVCNIFGLFFDVNKTMHVSGRWVQDSDIADGVNLLTLLTIWILTDVALATVIGQLP